jgi:hypothetical protein
MLLHRDAPSMPICPRRCTFNWVLASVEKLLQRSKFLPDDYPLYYFTIPGGNISPPGRSESIKPRELMISEKLRIQLRSMRSNSNFPQNR